MNEKYLVAPFFLPPTVLFKQDKRETFLFSFSLILQLEFSFEVLKSMTRIKLLLLLCFTVPSGLEGAVVVVLQYCNLHI